MKLFAEELRRLMRERGITQRALASALGISQPVVANVLNGKKRFPPARLYRLFDILGLEERQRRYLLRLYLADTLAGPLAKEADIVSSMPQKLEDAQVLAQKLMAAEERLARLRRDLAAGVRSEYYRTLLDALRRCGLVTAREYLECSGRLKKAKAGVDFTRIAAWMAIRIHRMVDHEVSPRCRDRLYRLLDEKTLEHVIAAAKKAAKRR